METNMYPSDGQDSKLNQSHIPVSLSNHRELLGNQSIRKTDQADKLNDKTYGVDLVEPLYKRRGGFGRNKENNWVKRLFSLNDKTLCYYDGIDAKIATRSKPRGSLNLTKEDTIAEMHIMQYPGAPTNFLLTINIYVLSGKKKWEICCENRVQQLNWYNHIAKFNNTNSEGTDTKDGNVSFYSDDSDEEKTIALNSPPKKNCRISTKEIMPAELRDTESALLNICKFFLHFLTLNMTAFFMRAGSINVFYISLLLSNLLYYFRVYNKNLDESYVKEQRGSSTKFSFLSTLPRNDDSNMSMTNNLKITKAGKTLPRAPLKKGCWLSEVVTRYGPNSAEAVRAYAKAGSDQYVENSSHCFWNMDPSKISLRIGPNYKKNRLKKPSTPALYNIHYNDVIRIDSMLKNASDAFEIPSIPGVTDVDTGHEFVPPMFVMNVCIPSYTPSLLSKEKDGPTYAIVSYCVITENTVRELKDFANASPAVKLLAEWCEKAQLDFEFRSRFKLIGLLENIEMAGLPSFVSRQNGRPALITKSGTFTRHSSYIEMSVDIREWGYLARKGINAVLPRVKDWVLNIAATIEGRDDSELPEVVLCGARLFQLNVS